MNILALGAGSSIGSEIAAAFSEGNHVRLAGRNAIRLEQAADSCRSHGAASVEVLVSDLQRGPDELLDRISGWPVDVLINAASAASQLRDVSIPADRVRGILEVDVATPLDVVSALCSRQAEHPPRVVFVSTILTVVKSPDRRMYGALKTLQEGWLRNLQAEVPGLEVLVVKVGKVLPSRATAATAKLAQAVLKAFEARKKTLYWGLDGIALAGLFYAQPLLFELAVRIRRKLAPVHPAANEWLTGREIRTGQGPEGA